VTIIFKNLTKVGRTTEIKLKQNYLNKTKTKCCLFQAATDEIVLFQFCFGFVSVLFQLCGQLKVSFPRKFPTHCVPRLQYSAVLSYTSYV